MWRHKFLIILGILVALSSGLGSSTSSGTNLRIKVDSHDIGFGFLSPGALSDPAIPLWLALILLGLGLSVALGLWVISTIARGGLIVGADAADRVKITSFSQAWRSGWNRGWTLLGIALVPAIPGLLLLLLAGVGALTYMTNASSAVGIPVLSNVTAVLAMLACLAIPVALLLEILRTFANRACMLEGLGVLDSYHRGIQVLGNNLGSALILFLLQIVVTFVMVILLIVPGTILALCCLFWPALVLFQGTVTAYFSTMWTLTCWPEIPGQDAGQMDRRLSVVRGPWHRWAVDRPIVELCFQRASPGVSAQSGASYQRGVCPRPVAGGTFFGSGRRLAVETSALGLCAGCDIERQGHCVHAGSRSRIRNGSQSRLFRGFS
jgi:hypothetical protein